MTLAPHVRTLGRGPGRSRSLTCDEAYDAMQIILNGQAAAESVGALLMLLRMKGEVADEIAGFTQALRDERRSHLLSIKRQQLAVGAAGLCGSCSSGWKASIASEPYTKYGEREAQVYARNVQSQSSTALTIAVDLALRGYHMRIPRLPTTAMVYHHNVS